MMAGEQAYLGQRRSYSGALCTVRYAGPLANTKGEWLGVEWDDPSRGKHNGQFEGQQIFTCLSSSPGAASFLRPSRQADPVRTLLEAIKAKYAPASTSGSEVADIIEISGKVVEEVGFDRIQQQLSVLGDLKIVLVDELIVSSIVHNPASQQAIYYAQQELAKTCPNVVELELGWNVIETWQDVVDMCASFRKLKILKAGGLRLRDFAAAFSEEHPFRQVEELYLNESLYTQDQILKILDSKGKSNFSALKLLSLSLNEIESFQTNGQTENCVCPSVTTIILENNGFVDLSSLPTLFSIFPSLTALSLQGNAISTLGLDPSVSFPSLETLNLANNKIKEYSFIDCLPRLFPNLSSLRISRNPLYEQLNVYENSTDGAAGVRQAETSSTTSDSTSYYLTLARILGLKSLNYTTIGPRDREEGEIYYLSVAEKVINSHLASHVAEGRGSSSEQAEELVAIARQTNPLYSPLCEKYDREDVLQRFLEQVATTNSTSQPAQIKSYLDAYAPGTLGSRLVDTYIYIKPPPLPSTSTSSIRTKEPFHRPLPTTISVYRLKSMVAQHFALPALKFRLVYESHEYDPVEPIHSTKDLGASAGAGWGDWDVDFDEEGHTNTNGDDLTAEVLDNEDGEAADEYSTTPKFVIREGHRFKKRETEILDGMRPWGDFLDVDAPDGTRRRDVRVRVEPQL